MQFGINANRYKLLEFQNKNPTIQSNKNDFKYEFRVVFI
ncbi:hypothetical protein PALI_a0988 [Pseudoalteromonas aliena SW19]|uniref:Uncharacterized protein n=1 Tax=Pseudoalteromonas aliena SW19 TaxID=1314866 RepID=A0ABR9DZY4_9GAMM|nr:hypothetical protein [Pseudoalteromonas aliena SW19]